MYNKVFISHSKKDRNLDFFHKVFSGLKTELITMEFEKIEPPPSITIQRKVNESNALFVLLSSYLLDLKHTGVWVAFEIGLAINRPGIARIGRPLIEPVVTHDVGVDVFVFDPLEAPIDFPIPNCKYYMPFERTEDELKLLRRILSCNYMEFGDPVKCPYKDCQLEFKLLKHINDFKCPACRKGIHFERPLGT